MSNKNISEDYVHRIGRTGRAGSTGHAYSLVSADEADFLAGIEKLIKQKLPREEMEGFEPEHPVPEGRAGKSGGNRSGGGSRDNNGPRGHNKPGGSRPRRSGGGGGGGSNRGGGGGSNRSGNSNGNSRGNTNGNRNAA
jgi:ATP-dependent RNA helicase RhlE